MRAPHEATRKVVSLAGSAEANALYKAFGEYNRKHFKRELQAPLVLITTTSARHLGDYCAKDVHGLQSRIRISPKAVERGELFMLDVLLHEMIHAWQHEVTSDLEPGYRGHGPSFARKCNEIGERLGLAPVGVKGRDGLPDCKYWPMCVRPEGYYPEAFTKPKNPNEKRGQGGEGEGDEGEPAKRSAAARAASLVDQLAGLVPELSESDEAIDMLRDRLSDLLSDLGAEMGEAAE